MGGRIHCSCEQPERDEVTNGLRGLEHGGDDAERREYRRTAHYDPPDAIRPDLASSLNSLSASLADPGRREDALAAIEKAAQVYREPAARWPDAYYQLETIVATC